MLIVSVVARFLSRLNTHTSWFCCLLLSEDELWLSETLPFASPWFKPICMDSQFKKYSLLFFPPNNDMWSPLTVAFVLVDLTWSTFCVHIFRRQLQTNMAVRLCDVASLLRSGSWAPEPWTGVCGTSFFKIIWPQGLPFVSVLRPYQWR